MPNSALAETYFIAAMMILILIVCGASVFFFFRTFQREKKAKLEADAAKKDARRTIETSDSK